MKKYERDNKMEEWNSKFIHVYKVDFHQIYVYI